MDKKKKQTQYQIPIECFAYVDVFADSLEEAIASLNRDSISDYRETFENFEVDKGGEVYIITETDELADTVDGALAKNL